MSNKQYLKIVEHYERCLAAHGDHHLGVDWPKQEDADTRYRVMLEVIRERSVAEVSILDCGCGASHFYEYLLKQQIQKVRYAGLDISPQFIRLSKDKFPQHEYFCIDILEEPSKLPSYDYIIMNGVFTEKRELSFDEMFAYFQQMILTVFEKTKIGMAFNVMSKHVDWERDDLFHLPFDVLAAFLTNKATRNFIIRNDYGLYEYTVYLYKTPTLWQK